MGGSQNKPDEASLDPGGGSFHSLGFDQTDLLYMSHKNSLKKQRDMEKLKAEQVELNGFRAASASAAASKEQATSMIQVPAKMHPSNPALEAVPVLKRKKRGDTGPLKSTKRDGTESATEEGVSTKAATAVNLATDNKRAATKATEMKSQPSDSAKKASGNAPGVLGSLVAYSSDEDSD